MSEAAPHLEIYVYCSEENCVQERESSLEKQTWKTWAQGKRGGQVDSITISQAKQQARTKMELMGIPTIKSQAEKEE